MEDKKKIAKPTVKKYTVLKPFTAERLYVAGEEFATEKKQDYLLKNKYIK